MKFASLNPPINKDSIITVVGGVHITSLSEAYMEMYPAIDISVVREGGFTICRLMEAIQNSIPLIRSGDCPTKG